MTLPIFLLRCNQCGYSQSGGGIVKREYVLPDGGALPLHSLPGWCKDCGQLEDIENLDPNQWLEKISAIKEQIASVQPQKKLGSSSFAYGKKG